MKKTKVIIIISMIILIIISAYLIIQLIKYTEEKNTNNINTNNININNINSINNEVEENTNLLNNNINNTNELVNQIDEEATTENKINTKTDNIQKALQIVEDNWGEDDSVYFRHDYTNSKGEYVICVRDKETTKIIYSYTVNVETGLFTIE